MDEVVRLDRKSFEALAGKTRVRVLKALLERRKTLTELSAELKFSPSTMKEHMGVLEEAGLVVQVDEGRKWKYYELTKMGERVARPTEIRAIVMLAASLFLLGAALLNMFSAVGPSALAQGELQYMAAPAGMDANAMGVPEAAEGEVRAIGGSAEGPAPAPASEEALPAEEGAESAWDEVEAGAPEAYGAEAAAPGESPGSDGAEAEKLAAASWKPETENGEQGGLPLLEIAMVLAAGLLAALALLNAREKKAL